jgi:Neutral/alkaline non-lysosomal ceramidase, N-terminal
MALFIGISRKIISPPPGIYLIGYGDRSKGNKGVHDDLTVTALAISDGLHHAVIVACDLLAINEHTVARILAQTGSNVVICCSHTHSGPISYAGSRSPRKNRYYISFLVSQIVEAVGEAHANLQPARLTWASGEAEIAVNRRERKPDGHVEIGVNPSGPVDSTFTLIQAQSLEGTPIVNLVNYQCHGTVLGPSNMLVSADWIGGMRRKVEALTNTPLIYLQGATGDLNPDHTWGENDYAALESIANKVAEPVFNSLASLTPVKGDAVSFHQEQVWLSLEAEVHGDVPPPTYRQVLSKMAGVPRFMVDPVLNVRYPWKTLIAAREGFWAVPVVLTLVRVGDLTIYTLGAEVFNEIGLAVKQFSATMPTIFASVSSGCIGYLPTAAEHALGGYEVDISPYFYRMPGRLKADSAEKVMQAIGRFAQNSETTMV